MEYRSQAESRRAPGTPATSRPGRRKRGSSTAFAENGELVAYTADEYGVRKNDGFGVVKPVNSSGGLLVLSILITIAFGGMLYGLVQIGITGLWEILGRTWWMFLLIQIPLLAGWTGYFAERKAEKLRMARHLPRPV